MRKRKFAVGMASSVLLAGSAVIAISATPAAADTAQAHGTRASAQPSGERNLLAPSTILFKKTFDGRCLSASARILNCNGTNSQKWRINPNGAGETAFSNVQTRQCFDSNRRGAVYMRRCNGGAFQKWYLSSGTAGSLMHNVATERCLIAGSDGYLSTGRCLDIRDQLWSPF
jgi:hypothetical protein